MARSWSGGDESVGARSTGDAFSLWLALGLLAHALMLGGGKVSLPSELALLVREMHRDQRVLFASIEVPIERPPSPPPAPPPEPEPEPEAVKPPPTPPPNAKHDPPPEPPPEPAKRFFAAAAEAVAQAAKVLTAGDDTPGGTTIASGESDGPMHGMVAGAGTGTVPTMNPHAALTGKPGGGGPPPPPAPDRTRGAHIYGGYVDDCDFPAEADVAGIDHAAATVIITVSAAGVPEVVEVIDDPGHGFGRAATTCALRAHYQPARDREGTLLRARTPPTTIRFSR